MNKERTTTLQCTFIKGKSTSEESTVIRDTPVLIFSKLPIWNLMPFLVQFIFTWDDDYVCLRENVGDHWFHWLYLFVIQCTKYNNPLDPVPVLSLSPNPIVR